MNSSEKREGLVRARIILRRKSMYILPGLQLQRFSSFF